MIKLSKFLALILRHRPDRFALEMDEEGWASLPEVMEILHGLPYFRWATRADVLQIVEQGVGDDKRRYEVEGKRIRARYGHSFRRRIAYTPCTPPERLYHGTAPGNVPSIAEEGLRSMGRQYVHLSADVESALRVGSRRAPEPVVLTVRAAEAHADGVAFYQAGEGIYLAEHVPPEFVESGGEGE
jgi:putative RNA 2'-phosphotransferase